MEPRKNPKADLTRKSGLFFNIGLVTALLMVITAFEWKFAGNINLVDLSTLDKSDMNIIDIPPTVHEPPKPPEIKHPKLIEIPNDEMIDEMIDINTDIEATEATRIDDYHFENDKPPVEKTTDFIFVEHQPSFQGGGPEKFLQYIAKNIKYPAQAKRMGIQGKVFLEFVIDREGKIVDVKVLKGIGAGCDTEAKRVISSAPDWSPGKQRAEPVRVRMIIPINFTLN